MRNTYTLAILFSISTLLLPFNNTEASELRSSIDKYKGAEVSSRTLRQLEPYNEYIDYFSQFTFFRKNHKVSSDFIRALIIAESNVDPNAVSPKNAMGLGQIILTTGQEAAKEISRSRFSFKYVDKEKLKNLKQEDLFDPATNILLTCYLISKYNYKFNGRLELVLSAWNAGENHKALDNGRPVPYEETMNLIGKINGYYISLLQKKKQISIYARP